MAHVRPDDLRMRRRRLIVVAVVIAAVVLIGGGTAAFLLLRPAGPDTAAPSGDPTVDDSPVNPIPTTPAGKPSGKTIGKCPDGAEAMKTKLLAAARKAPDGPGDIPSLKFAKGPECDPDGKFAWGKLSATDESGEPLDDLAMVFTLSGDTAKMASFSTGCLTADAAAKAPPGAITSIGCK